MRGVVGMLLVLEVMRVSLWWSWFVVRGDAL